MAGPVLDVFRVLGDASHTFSKLVLIYAIHRNRSAEGVSLLTQLLYIVVFVTRYLDLFWVPPAWSFWNFFLKIFYIASSAYIVFVMMRVFARTREKEQAWKLALWSLAGSAVLSPVVTLIFKGWAESYFTKILDIFSLILESVCVLPQLLLLRQTSVPTVIDSFYLLSLGSYRGFYILHWLVRGASGDDVDPVSIIFGIVQTTLYVDFFWVYYTRQRVKLRGGRIMDSDDLSKSLLVRRFIGTWRGRHAAADEEDVADEHAALAGQENGTIRPSANPAGHRWGARGISISADDTLAEHDQRKQPDPADGAGSFADEDIAGDAHMMDPAHFEDQMDGETDAPPPPSKGDARQPPKGEASDSADTHGHGADDVGSSAAEWQENVGSR